VSQKKATIRIKNGIVVSGRGLQRIDVLVKDGLVEALEPPESPAKADKTIDASGKYVLPGIIDAHLHPVYGDRIDTLSKGAAYGGVTTLIPFIGAIKAVIYTMLSKTSSPKANATLSSISPCTAASVMMIWRPSPMSCPASWSAV
jgi:N-acetylglucosamine-6-phosphate deacetylase